MAFPNSHARVVLHHIDGSSIYACDSAPADAPPSLRELSASLSWWSVQPPAITGESRTPDAWRQSFPLLLLRVDDLVGQPRVEAALKWLFTAIDTATSDSMSPIGFHTESQKGALCTLQLYFKGRAVILHAPSGAFPAHAGSPLRAMLEGTWASRPAASMFTGADLTVDALDVYERMAAVTMHACIDVTALHAAAAADPESQSLRSMLSKVHGCDDWHKPAVVGRSNWAAVRLTSEQIKYAALDAWASAVVGADAINSLATVMLDPSCAAFTLRAAPTALLHRACILLREGRALAKAQDKSYRVPVVDVTVDSTVQLAIHMAEFDRRVRQRYPVVIQLTGDADEVIKGKCASVEGRRAVISLETGAAVKVMKQFRAKPDSVTFSTDNSTDPASVLLQAAGTIKAMVRAWRLKSCFDVDSRSTLQLDVTHSQRALAAYRTLFDTTPITSAASGVRLHHLHDAAIAQHGVRLDASQREALRSAVQQPLTAIRGPPGTGKTRLIAALAESLADCGERMVLVAPANAATRRILETNLNAGYNSMALAVSKDYFFSWHEQMYDHALMRYTVTPAAEDPQVDSMRQSSVWLTDGARTPASTTVTVSSLVLNVGLHSSAVSVEESVYTKRRNMQWSQLLQSLIVPATVTALIVDEASQLWEGLLLRLLVTFPQLRTIVLVGDEHQLPPYGADKAACRSAFECVLKRPGACVHSLGITYRLPATVARLLNSRFYGGTLTTKRQVADDERAWDLLGAGARSGHASSLSAAVWGRAVSGRLPLQWLHVEAADAAMSRARDSQSLANDGEVRIAAQLAADLIAYDASIPAAVRAMSGMPRMRRIVVITPYQHQRERIETELCRLLASRAAHGSVSSWMAHVRGQRIVTCVDGFQGQEADIVILSLVRCRGLGFLRDDRRCNVMLSRVSHAMIVLGNVNTFLAADVSASGAAPHASAVDPAQPPSVLRALAETCAEAGLLIEQHAGGIQRKVPLDPRTWATLQSLTAPATSMAVITPASAPQLAVVPTPAAPARNALLSPSAVPHKDVVAPKPPKEKKRPVHDASQDEAFKSFVYARLAHGPVELSPLGQAWQQHCAHAGLPYAPGGLKQRLMRLPDVRVERGPKQPGRSRPLIWASRHVPSAPAGMAPAPDSPPPSKRTPKPVPRSAAKTPVPAVTPRSARSVRRRVVLGETDPFADFMYAKLERGPVNLYSLGAAWQSHCHSIGRPYSPGNLAKQMLRLPGVVIQRDSDCADIVHAMLERDRAQFQACADDEGGDEADDGQVNGDENAVEEPEFAAFVVDALHDGAVALAALGDAWREHCKAMGQFVGHGKLTTRLSSIPGVCVEYTAESAGGARAYLHRKGRHGQPGAVLGRRWVDVR